jgi:FG-GAP repeat
VKHFYLLLSLVFFVACGTSTTQSSGTLSLDIQGIPEGIQANVVVAGANGFQETLGSSQRLENLTAGDYTITAQDVIQGSDTYFPDKRQQSVVIKAGETASLAVTYSKQDVSAGSLEITVSGLPAGASATIVVTGPFFNQQLTTSGVLSNLTPGEYQLTADDVTVEADRYTASPASQTIGVAAGSKTDVSVTYAKQAATLGQLAITITGLPTDLNAALSVTGPNGFSESVPASKTLNDLQPGDYEITALKVDGTYPYYPTPATQTLKVVASETAKAVVVYVPTITKGAEGDRFGSSLAVEGDFMVIGAPYNDANCLKESGTAYVYQRTATGEWTFVKELDTSRIHPVVASELTPSACLLEPSGVSGRDHFGYSVAMSGDTVVVGAPHAIGECTVTVCARAGAAYIFERNEGGTNNFGFVKELSARDGAEADEFGRSIAILGKTILVGSPYHDNDADADGSVECGVATDDSECNNGSAYLFSKGLQGMEALETWSEGFLITPNDGANGDLFGFSVALALNGDMAVIGSPFDSYDADGDGTVECLTLDESECRLGSTYVFVSSGKSSTVTKLTAKKATARNQFGSYLTADDSTIVVGLGEDATTSSAFIFGRGNDLSVWNELKTITLENTTTARETVVALNKDKLVIALPYVSSDVNGDGTVDCIGEGTMNPEGTECFTGAAYLFERSQGGANNFGLVKSFVAGDGVSDDNFGYAVAISADAIIASSPGRTEDAGAVYIFEP